jgi:RNA polymerase sigma-70 factor, ECF subfamily
MTHDDARLAARQWLNGVQRGDADAYEALFREFYPRLHRYLHGQVCCWETAGDLAQDIFVRLWQRRRALEVHGSVSAYLYRAAYLEAINHRRNGAVRRREAESRGPDEPIPGLGQSAPSAESTVYAGELRTLIECAVARLPARRQEVLQLRWEHQLSYAEIADVLGISPKTVENHINLAFKSLRDAVQPVLG